MIHFHNQSQSNLVPTRMFLMHLAAALTLLVSLSLKVDGSGKVEIHLVTYDNPGGKGENGHCCDGRWGVCTSACDHTFNICLGSTSSDDEMDSASCQYGLTQSGAVKDQNNITFGSTIQDIPNPVVFSIDGPLAESMALKVDIWDSDKYFGADHVEFLRQDINMPSTERNVILQGRTILKVEVTSQCDPNYYSVTCDILCPPPSFGQHYTCHADTGIKVCDPGWTGETCSKVECHPECQNGGVCTNMGGFASCHCPEDFVGEDCGHHVCESRCDPGQCEWSEECYHCTCPPGYKVLNEGSCGDTCVAEPTTTTTTAPTTPTASAYFDCSDHPGGLNGVYDITSGGDTPFPALCDDNWTVIQQRVNGSENFYRTWADYKSGFGTPGPNGEFWLGLENMHQMTSQKGYKLRIELFYRNNNTLLPVHAEYQEFSIGSEEDGYILHVDRYSGDAGNGLQDDGVTGSQVANGQPFSTKDRDNDDWSHGSCARGYHSAWWYKRCYQTDLNGVYATNPSDWPFCECIAWMTLGYYPITWVQMKIQPNGN